MRAFFQPSDGPTWLSRVLASIRAALGDAWDAPFGLWQAKTAELPGEARFTGRIAWNVDHARVTYSDGDAWRELQPYDATLAALADCSAIGFLVQTDADMFAGRTLQAPAAGLTIGNPAGAAGNPTFALANDLAAVEGLSSTGLAVRTGADAWAVRSIAVPAAGLSIANANGASGNPTLALANDLAALEGLGGTGIARRTAADSWSVGATVAVAEGGTGATSVKGAIAVLRSGAMVRKSADQIGANYTAGPAIAWDAEVYDDDGWHDNVTNNTRLTVPAGVSRVRVGCSVDIGAGTTTSGIFLTLLKNAVNTFEGAIATSFVAGQATPALNFSSGPIAVVPGDYFEVSLFYATDTSINVVAAQSNFWIEAA